MSYSIAIINKLLSIFLHVFITILFAVYYLFIVLTKLFTITFHFML